MAATERSTSVSSAFDARRPYSRARNAQRIGVDDFEFGGVWSGRPRRDQEPGSCAETRDIGFPGPHGVFDVGSPCGGGGVACGGDRAYATLVATSSLPSLPGSRRNWAEGLAPSVRDLRKLTADSYVSSIVIDVIVIVLVAAVRVVVDRFEAIAERNQAAPARSGSLVAHHRSC